MKQRIISIVLVLSMVASLFGAFSLNASAAENALPETMWIAPSDSNGVPSQITLCTPFVRKTSGGGFFPGGGGGWGGWNPGGQHTTPDEPEESGYQLYLPGNIDSAKCYLSWEGGLLASDGTKTYASSELPVPKPGETKTYTFTLGTESKSFEISCYQGSAAVKPIFIEIDESQGTIEAMNSDRDHETTCTGIIYIDGEKFELPKMKGRGNYSWANAVQKRPYNITLGKKTNLLGIDCDKTKKWSLLANVNDHTLLRNKIAYDLGFKMGIGFDSATTDVWMNGEYQGTYLLTPKTDSFITDDGYLIENDNYREDSVESGGDPSFTVSGHKESDTNYATSGLLTTVKKIGKNLLEGGEETPEALTAAATPIRAYLQDAWDALGAKDGKNSKGKYYTDYFDFQKAACMYLLQEFVKNLEVDGGSIFFHRDGTTDGDKLIAGPAWDYDNALGFNGTSFGGGDRLCVSGWFFTGENSTSISFYGSSGGNLFTTFARHDDLKAEAKRMYNIYHTAFEGIGDSVKQLADEIEASAEMNFVRVTKETMNAYDMSSPKTTDKETKYETTYKATDTWRDYVENLYLYTSGRTRFMSDELLDAETAEGYTASFVLGKNSSVTVYPTQDVTSGGIENPTSAYARSSATGEIDMTGDGQINFVVNLENGYQISNIKVEPVENYKNLKGPIDTGIENGYRVTKITGPVTITVETQEYVCDHEFEDGKCTKCGLQAYQVEFSCDHATVTVYPTQSLDGEKAEKATLAYARDSVSGDYDTSGSGQVNFVVIPEVGYEIESVTAEPKNYKNLKAPDETLVENGYRVTKITGNLTVTVKAVKSSCQHNYKAVVTDPTCTEMGYTIYTCTLCGDSYKGDETEALGHKYREEAHLPAYSCSGYSVFIYTCERCGDTNEVEYAPAPHDWDDGKITVEPTEATKGTKVYTCKVCGMTRSETIPELLHTHKYTASVTTPTCEADGYTTYTCVCGESYEADAVPAKGHSYVNGKCTECGAADPDWVEPKTCPSEKFTDAPDKENWAHEGIDYCIERGYMNGVSDTAFNPQGNVTRAQLVTILYRVANTPDINADKALEFSDVEDDQWYSKAVAWASSEGIVNGVGNGRFNPNGAITREQIAAIFFRYAKAEVGESDLSIFPDSGDAHTYSMDALSWAVEKGILTGVKSNDVTYLKPLANATRAQIASILMRYLKGI